MRHDIAMERVAIDRERELQILGSKYKARQRANKTFLAPKMMERRLAEPEDGM